MNLIQTEFCLISSVTKGIPQPDIARSWCVGVRRQTFVCPIRHYNKPTLALASVGFVVGPASELVGLSNVLHDSSCG